ncbi:MAG: prepilin-type N-terminal cleavage/methylation domain-containing protein [Thermomicrobiales bacterium]|jgi:prepilin-type N-terminal cleavage/methylation domain-containing protein
MHKQDTSSDGFTIVELVIVIVVIAVLATISVVAYRGIQNRAMDTAVEADIAAIRRKLELAKIDLGHYPQTASEFPDFKLNKAVYDTGQNNIFYCLDMINDRYSFGFISKSLTGYLLAPNGLSAGVSVTPGTTCAAVNKTWTNDATTVTILGYFGPPYSTWSGWKWTI